MNIRYLKILNIKWVANIKKNKNACSSKSIKTKLRVRIVHGQVELIS